MTGFMEKYIFLPILATGLTFSLYSCGRQLHNAPERLVGFKQYTDNGYALRSVEIPTDGDVTEVRETNRPVQPYRTTKNPDGSITIEGEFDYTIEDSFPSNYRSDKEREIFLNDTRHGKITLEKQ